jgi:putative endonuclease
LNLGIEVPRPVDTPIWWLYLLACKDGRTYAGIAIDVDARFRVHASGKGSKFTRANPPLAILGAQSFATKSEALQAEAALKRLRPAAKRLWARQWQRPSPQVGKNFTQSTQSTPSTQKS